MQHAGRTTQVFISYSRKDLGRAEALRNTLISMGFDVFLDKHDILPSEPWKERLSSLIERADVVLFLISSESVASKICDWEVNEAERLSKRIVPVVIRDTSPDAVPNRLTRLNFIFLRDASEEVSGFSAIGTAINADITWVREHTRLAVLAADWSRDGRRTDMLLRGTALAAAELWISRASSESQPPTPQHREFIIESRRNEQAQALKEQSQLARTRRFQRAAGWGLSGVAILIVFGLIYSTMQTRATARREAAVLASFSQKSLDQGQYARALRSSLLGLPRRGEFSLLAPWSDELEEKLGTAAIQSRNLVAHLNHADGTAFHWLRGRSDTLATIGRRAARIWSIPGGRLVYSLQFDREADWIRWSKNAELLIGAFEREARIWRLGTTGATALYSLPHRSPISAASFSNDGQFLFTATDDGSAMLADASSGDILWEPSHDSRVNDAVFAGNGRRLIAWTNSRMVYVWDLETGKHIAILKHERHVDSVRTSDDGRVFVIVTGGEAHLRLSEDAQPIFSTPLRHSEGDAIRDVVFSPDSRRIVTLGRKHAAGIWNTSSGANIAMIPHSGEAFSVVLSGDGNRLATASFRDRAVRVWDGETGAPLRELPHENGEVTKVSISGDGRVIASIAGNNVNLWSAESERVVAVAPHDPDANATSGAVIDAGLNPDASMLVTRAHDGAFRLWRTTEHPEFAVLNSKGKVIDASFLPGAQEVMTSALEDGVRLIENLGRGIANTITTQTVSVEGMSADRQWIAWPSTHGVLIGCLRDVKKSIELRTGSVVRRAVLSPDITRLVTISDGARLDLWAVPDGQLIASWHHGGDVRSVVFSRDSLVLASTSSDRLAVVRDAVKGKELAQLAHLRTVYAADFSPDGATLATAAGGNVHVWQWREGVNAFEPLTINALMTKIKFSPDGTRLAAAGLGGGHLWSEKGIPIRPMEHASEVNSIEFSLDGRWIVTASRDKAAKVWDGRSGIVRLVLEHGESVEGARISHDRQFILTFSGSRTNIWDVGFLRDNSGAKLREYVCREWPAAALQISKSDGIDPVLRGREGTSVCNPGLLSWLW